MLLLLLLLVSPLSADDSLQLVQILFRHGDRTPSHTFPTDPYRWSWPEGREQLTRLGQRQQWELGRYLRRRYAAFLPARYNVSDTRVRSTDSDRAILSAQAQLLGLYAGEGPGPDLQLVPVHTVPKAQDQLLKMTSPCPAYARLWAAVQRSPLWSDLEQRYRPLFARLAAGTGLERVGLLRAFQIADPVTVWRAHNLSLPAWATPEVVRELNAVHDLKQWLRYLTKPMQRLRGGPLVARLTDNMLGKAAGGQRRWFAFSAHDSTLAAVQSYLGVFNRRQPPYCAALIVELRRRDGRFLVRLLYRNESAREPFPLAVPGCGLDCPLERFETLVKSNLPDNVSRECFAVEEDALMSAHWVRVVYEPPWSLMVFVTLSGVAMLLMCTVYKRFRRP